MVLFPNRIIKPQMMINTTVPGVRLPSIASLILAIIMLMMEQIRKKFRIVIQCCFQVQRLSHVSFPKFHSIDFTMTHKKELPRS